MKRIQPLASLLLFAVLPASAAWTVTRNGAPSGCSHVISDGNWQIGVYRYSDDNWSLGKQIGYNGSPYLAGSGDLDLTGVTTMGDNAFTGCTKITGTLTFPGLTTMFGTYQFEDWY